MHTVIDIIKEIVWKKLEFNRFYFLDDLKIGINDKDKITIIREIK